MRHCERFRPDLSAFADGTLPPRRWEQVSYHLAGCARCRDEVAAKADKFGRQIRYADRRGIPFVWFGAGYDDSVKDIRSGDQQRASPETWEPPAADLVPVVGPAD